MRLAFILLLLFPFVSLSCFHHSEVAPAVKEEVSDTTTANYSRDWRNFVTAVQSRDKANFIHYCSDNIKDYDGLLNMLADPFVLRKMEESNFDDLEPVELEGVEYLKFYAEDIGIDEFGYEYATAVTLYFLKTDTLLVLDNYSAAG